MMLMKILGYIAWLIIGFIVLSAWACIKVGADSEKEFRKRNLGKGILNNWGLGLNGEINNNWER